MRLSTYGASWCRVVCMHCQLTCLVWPARQWTVCGARGGPGSRVTSAVTAAGSGVIATAKVPCMVAQIAWAQPMRRELAIPNPVQVMSEALPCSFLCLSVHSVSVC